MRLLICSDIHGDEYAFLTLLKLRRKLQCSSVISAGDFCPDSSMELTAMNEDFITVQGNCDRWRGFSIMADPKPYMRFHLGERQVVVTHGDRTMPSNYDLKEGDIFISGHTHVPVLDRDRHGIILLNPGSPSRPRSMEGATFMTIDEKKAELRSFPDGTLIREMDY